MKASTVRAVGIAWYRQEDFNRCRKLFIDGRKLPATFTQWRKAAERGVEQLTKQGHIVERIIIDPDTFPAWCASQGMDIDAHARQKYASLMVARKYRDQS